MIEAVFFIPPVHFLRVGLASPHSNNSHQTGQSIFTTDPAKSNVSAVEKLDIGEGTVEPLTQAKEKSEVKSKFVVCSTEEPSEFYINISFKISVKGRLRQSLDYWDKIIVNKTIREIISEGCKIPFISTPKIHFFKTIN